MIWILLIPMLLFLIDILDGKIDWYLKSDFLLSLFSFNTGSGFNEYSGKRKGINVPLLF
jgi:hypothetical protein